MSPEQMAKALQEMHAREQRRLAEAEIETKIKVLSAIYDKASAYTNLMIVAAYAGFFGLWQLAKDTLPKDLARWSALLMLISVVIFVAVEVIKMVMVQHSVFSQASTLNTPEVRQSPEALNKAFAKIGAAHEQVNFYFRKLWVVALILTILSGMSAASILGYAFVAGLER